MFPEVPKRHRIHRGLITERQEHIFTWMAVVVILLYVSAWVGAIVEIRRRVAEPAFGPPAGPAARPPEA